MRSDLNPQDVVLWARQQAKKFAEMADDIERTFNLRDRNGAPDPALVQRITQSLSDGKARRVGQIAEQIQAADSEIRHAIEHSRDALRINERGWVTRRGDVTPIDLTGGGERDD